MRAIRRERPRRAGLGFTTPINYQTKLQPRRSRRAGNLAEALGQISDAVCPGERQPGGQTSCCLALFRLFADYPPRLLRHYWMVF